jgi:hypothetical protein
MAREDSVRAMLRGAGVELPDRRLAVVAAGRQLAL